MPKVILSLPIMTIFPAADSFMSLVLNIIIT